MSEKNKKYGVKPEVLAQLEFTERDKLLANWQPKMMIQGIVATKPEDWTEDQLWKAKELKINTWDYERLRYEFDNETNAA
jgi:hypothetical protein